MNTKDLYQVSEVARVCGVSRSTILRLEDKGLITPCYVAPDSGRRYYDIYDVAKINHIEHFKEMGLTVEEIATYYSSQEGELETLHRLEEKLYHFERSVEEMRLRIHRSEEMKVQFLSMSEEICLVKRGVGFRVDTFHETMKAAYRECVDRKIVFKRRPIFTEFECEDYLHGIVPSAPFAYTVCIPVKADKAPPDAVTYPACRALSVVYYGAYDRDKEAWLRLGEEVRARGLTPIGWPRSMAVVAAYSGREIDSTRWCTRVLVPIAEDIEDEEL